MFNTKNMVQPKFSAFTVEIGEFLAGKERGPKIFNTKYGKPKFSDFTG